MAKLKEPTTQVAVTGVDPRARMKEIRAEVKAFLKGDTLGLAHLGDLPNTMEDARRVIIATQDLLEIERDKHRKATLHICELVAILDGMSETQQELMTMVNQRDREIYQLQQLNARHEQEIATTRREAQNMRQQRDAVLTTMRLERNMDPPAPMVMGVDMGSSNAAEPARRRGPTTFEELLNGLAYNGGTVTGRLR
mgnify:CR=1 FL=1